MNDETAGGRLHYLDSMRSVLMMLGVVLHSARPYDSYAWQVKDAERMPMLDGLVEAIHLFRMPAFFVVAGYFAMYLVLRRPALAFFGERMRRILVPLLATLLTFNVVQVWVVMGSGGDAGFLEGSLLPALASGRWVSHLWFLAVLAFYLVLVTLSAPVLRRLADPQARVARWLSGRWTLPLMLLVAVSTPVGVAAAAKLAPDLTDLVLGAASTAEMLRFAPSFAIGMVLCVAPRLLDRFAGRSVAVVALALCGLAGMQLTAERPEYAYRAINMFATALLSWMVVRILFSLFRDWVNRPSRLWAYLSSASYSIYLFHHLTVIVTATFLLSLPWAAGTKFAIVLTASALVPLALHHFLVRRHRVLGYLFNGRVSGGRHAATANTATLVPGLAGKARSPAVAARAE